jgi:XTP/dITP diphosphohydrolase
MNKKFIGKKLVIASNNPGKVKEISALLVPYAIEVISVADFNIKEPDETGLTFVENAKLKAEYYGKILNLPALADDSGICIEALEGFPGVYSARVAGPDKDFDKAFNEIEAKLLAQNLTSSPAYFICSLALWTPSGDIQDFEGRVDGIVSFPATGEQGFGYDPIFTPRDYNQRFAQMDPELKNTISHRSLAFKTFIETCF